MAEFSTIGEETNTLEDSLKQFDVQCLLEELDLSLDLVRRNKTTVDEHLEVLKTVDKNLRKLCRIHHPDKSVSSMKSEQEVAQSQNRQAALNATRTVLQALTKAFLSDIDIHYRYEFFAKMNISSIVNEKEMDRQIMNVLSKIGFLSEVKRVNIVGEIRKFLQESLQSLNSFQDDERDEFERHRDYALCHLSKCIEGYEVLTTECELIKKECSGGNDGSAMQKIYDQSLIEMKILQGLERTAEKSLRGQLQIFSVFEATNSYDRYLISPFVLYTNLMLMCTTVINGKLGIMARIKNFARHNSPTSLHFDTKPNSFYDAYNLASYFMDKEKYEWSVQSILQKGMITKKGSEKGLHATDDNIIKEFKDIVKNIADFLIKEFDIDSYKEGKSNRQYFVEKLSRLNKLRTGYEEVEKLQEVLDQCKQISNEIREGSIKYSEKLQETEEQCRKNKLKCKNTSEQISKLMSGGYQKEGNRSRIYYGNEVNEIVGCNETDEDSTEIMLSKKLEDYEKVAENLLEFLKDCSENDLEQTGRQSIGENGGNLVFTGEVERKIRGIYELNKKVDEQLGYLMKIGAPKFAKQGNVSEKHLEDGPLRASSDTISVDEIGRDSNSSDVTSFQSSSSQNVPQNSNVVEMVDSTNYVPNHE